MSRKQVYRGLIAALPGLFLSYPTQAAVDPNFYVFLAFGQSNMEGYANLKGDITDADKTSLPRFQVLGATTCSGLQRTKNQWSPGIAPLFRCGTGLSPADYFARTLVDSLPSHIRIGIIPVAVAGSKIEGFDPASGKSYYAKEAPWMQNIVKEYDGDPYARMVAMGKIAQQTGVVKGILLHQGESNSGDAADVWGKKVNTTYQALLKDLGLNAKDVPLLAGHVANTGGFNTKIDALPKTIPTAFVISSSGLAIHSKDSGISSNCRCHFSPASYREFGKRYARQMLKLLPKSSAIGHTEMAANLTSNADYAVFDVRGARVAGFHATDAASMDAAWAGIKKTNPPGIYWMRNGSTGAAVKFVNGR